MVELVELFVAAGLFGGAALQPVTNKIAPSAIKIKVGFILFLFPAATIYLTDTSARQKLFLHGLRCGSLFAFNLKSHEKINSTARRRVCRCGQRA